MPTTISGASGVNNVAPNSVNFEDLKTTLFNGLLGLSGYIKIPVNDQGVEREVIVQWGSRTSGVTATGVVLFPIPFPNACLNVSITDQALSQANVSATGVNASLTTTQFTFYAASSIEGGNFFWIAIGY